MLFVTIHQTEGACGSSRSCTRWPWPGPGPRRRPGPRLPEPGPRQPHPERHDPELGHPGHHDPGRLPALPRRAGLVLRLPERPVPPLRGPCWASRTPASCVSHEERPHAWAALKAALDAPSLYDDALSQLAVAGLPVPIEVLNRDVSQPYAPSEAVEEAWLQVYQDTQRWWPSTNWPRSWWTWTTPC